MAQNIINDGQGGLSVREALNDNFDQLFGAGQFPIKIANVGGSFGEEIPANTWVSSTFITPLLGAPNISIYIMDVDDNPVYFIQDFTFTSTTAVSIQQYFDVDTVLYFTFNNTDTCNIRIDLITDFN